MFTSIPSHPPTSEFRKSMSSFFLLPQGAASHCSRLPLEERIQQNGACGPRADPCRTIKVLVLTTKWQPSTSNWIKWSLKLVPAMNNCAVLLWKRGSRKWRHWSYIFDTVLLLSARQRTWTLRGTISNSDWGCCVLETNRDFWVCHLRSGLNLSTSYTMSEIK